MLRANDGGLSIWRVSSSRDRQLVVAERALTKGRIEPTDFIEVDEQVVTRFGPITPCAVDTAIKQVGILHVELRWEQSQLTELSEFILDEQTTAQRIKAADTRVTVAALTEDDLTPRGLELRAQLKL